MSDQPPIIIRLDESGAIDETVSSGRVRPDLSSPDSWPDTFNEWLARAAVLDLADLPASADNDLSIFMDWLQQQCREGIKLSALDGSKSVFQSPVRLQGKIFTGAVNFDGARFNRGVDFSGSQFEDVAHFRNAVFSDVADFTDCDFGQDAGFEGATFDIGDFRSAQFHGGRRFDDATHTTGLYPRWFDLGPWVPLVIAATLTLALLGLRFGNLTDRGQVIYVVSAVVAATAGLFYLLGQRMGWRSPAWPRSTRMMSAMTAVLAASALAAAMAGLVADVWLQPGDDSEPPVGLQPSDESEVEPDTDSMADQAASAECVVVGTEDAECVVLDSNGNPVIGNLTVDLGGFWLTAPQPVTGQPTTNEAGRILLGQIIDNLATDPALSAIADLTDSATGTATSVLSDNIDGLVDIVDPIIETVVASDPDDDATPVFGPDIDQQVMLQLGDHDEFRQWPAQDRAAMMIAIKQSLADNPSVSTSFEATGTGDQVTVVIINEAGRGHSRTMTD